ncbi:ABC transporter permease [Cryptosporangium aurantiacum]|uniref:Branched-chain amino acid transport system permease protein n=1 Tax=Cryptosporangium aurantiacum TaxID=134849 RepID=A0A1M7PDX4_9ACTN|nr:ABC transporter permease [Cryptosporangium aurantiacum]SHN15136.1 branched-chain amino acid transport system permease protein [Cryptosporangium aurantiacum]
MDQLLLFVLLGLGPGALIAGLALALVLTHRGSGTINLAVGAFAVLGAYVFYGLRTDGYLFLIPLPLLPDQIDFGGPWATAPALLAALGICALAGAIVDLAVLRPLRTASPLAKLLATLGVLVVIQSAVTLRFGSDGQVAPDVFPAGPEDVVRMAGATVPQNRFALAVVVLLATVALALVYRFTRFGLASRAAAENETLAVVSGLAPTALSLVNTVTAAVVAGGLGVLAASQTQLDPRTIPLAVIPALGAALLARFSSFLIATGAGLTLGIVQSVLVYLQSRPWFPTADGQPVPGIADLLFFLVIVGAMLWQGAALPQRGVAVEQRLPSAVAPSRLARPTVIGAIVLTAAFLILPFGFRQALINSLIATVVCLSLVVITGYVGQVSLIQVALAGVAGFTVSRLAESTGLGFPFAPLLGIAAAVALGTLTAFSALRVRGVNLAIVTIAGAVALQSFGFQNPVWGAGVDVLKVPPPTLAGIELGPDAPFPINFAAPPSPVFGLCCAAVLLCVALFVGSLRRSTLGKQLLAVRSNERAAAAAGISVRNVKLLAFALSSAIAGIGGALYAYNYGAVSSDRFDLMLALTFVAFAYVGGIASVPGALIAGLGVTAGLMGYLLDGWIGIPSTWQLLLGGFALVLTIAHQPDGIAGQLRRSTHRRTPAGAVR